MGMQTSEEIIDVDSVTISPKVDKEAERIVLMIKEATTLADLKAIEPHVKEPQLDLFTVKMDELKAKK